MIALVNMKQTASAKAASTSTAIGLLQKLAPPQAIIHIGAGCGYGEIHQWRQWNVPHALIIDANRERLDWAQPLITGNPGWHIVNEIVADTDGEIDYYQASNPEEDGIISPQQMSSFWPNLRTTIHSVRPCRSLDSLLTEDTSISFEQATPVWVFIDCLPALPILKGAGEHIDRWSVLWLRVLLQQANEIDEGAALQSIESYLQPFGFRCIEISESNHPAIGYALFARDWRAVLESRDETLSLINSKLSEEKSTLEAQQEALKLELALLGKSYDEQAAQTEQLMGQLAALKQERDNHANQVVEQQAQIDRLAETNANLTADQEMVALEKSVIAEQFEALKQEVAVLGKARDEQTAFSEQLLGQIEVQTQERDGHAGQVVEQQTQIEALIQSNATLTEEKSVLAAQMDTLVQEISALTQSNAALDQEKKGLRQWCDALEEELDSLTQAHNVQAKLVEDEQARIKTMEQERDDFAREVAESQAQIEALSHDNIALNADREVLTQEKSELAAQYDTLKQEVTVLVKARDELMTLANQRLAVIETQIQERDHQAKQLVELQAQINSLSETNSVQQAEKETLIREKSVLETQQQALKHEVVALSKARDEQNTLANQRQARIEVLTKERDSHASQAAKLQAQIDTLTQTNTALKDAKQTLIQEKSALANQHDALKLEMAALSKARDEQSALANQRKAQIEAVTKERDSHASQAAKLQAQIDTLTQTNIDLKADKEAIAKEKSVLATQHETLKQEVALLGKVRDEQGALAIQRQALIEILTMPKTDHHLEPYVLALNNYDPFRTVGGGATRLQGLYAATAQWSNVVVVCFFEGTSIEVVDIGERIKCIRIPKTLEHLKQEKYFNSRFHIPTNDIVDLRNADRNPVLNDIYDMLRKRASIVVCDHIYMVPLPRRFGDRFVYSSHNFEYKLKKDLLNGHPDKDELIKEVYNAERFCVTSSDLIVTVSAEDGENFTRDFNATAPIIVVPNGASIPVVSNPEDVNAVKGKIYSRSAVFLGSAHKPNVDAAKFIVDSLAPVCPDIEFHFVGSVCQTLPGELPSNVRTWGVLNESMKSAVLQSCKVAINPMFSGGGSNVKLADFLMNGLYVVSTSFGVRGYPDTISAHVTIANQESFPEALRNVLDNPDISDEIKRMERRTLFIEHLSMRSLAKQFVDVLSDFDQPKSSQIEALTQERNSYANQAVERQAQIDTLTKSNTDLKADKEALIQEKSALMAQHESLKQEVAKLDKSCDEQSALAHQRLAQIDTMTQAQTDQTKMVAGYKTELEELQLRLQQSSARIAQLESELSENDVRQHLLNEEMIKAEAQIELIKDVLLREPGL